MCSVQESDFYNLGAQGRSEITSQGFQVQPRLLFLLLTIDQSQIFRIAGSVAISNDNIALTSGFASPYNSKIRCLIRPRYWDKFVNNSSGCVRWKLYKTYSWRDTKEILERIWERGCMKFWEFEERSDIPYLDTVEIYRHIKSNVHRASC